MARYTCKTLEREYIEPLNAEYMRRYPDYENGYENGRGPFVIDGAYGGYEVQFVRNGSTGRTTVTNGHVSARCAAQKLEHEIARRAACCDNDLIDELHKYFG